MHPPPNPSTSLVLTIYVATLSVGLPANIFALATILSKVRQGLAPSDVLLLNLTAADLLLMLFLPFKVAEEATGDRRWPLPAALCPVANFCFFSSIYLSILFLAALSVERYLSVAFPLRPKRRRRPGLYAVASCVLWLLATSHCSVVFAAAFGEAANGSTNGTNGPSRAGGAVGGQGFEEVQEVGVAHAGVLEANGVEVPHAEVFRGDGFGMVTPRVFHGDGVEVGHAEPEVFTGAGFHAKVFQPEGARMVPSKVLLDDGHRPDVSEAGGIAVARAEVLEPSGTTRPEVSADAGLRPDVSEANGAHMVHAEASEANGAEGPHPEVFKANKAQMVKPEALGAGGATIPSESSMAYGVKSSSPGGLAPNRAKTSNPNVFMAKRARTSSQEVLASNKAKTPKPGVLKGNVSETSNPDVFTANGAKTSNPDVFMANRAKTSNPGIFKTNRAETSNRHAFTSKGVQVSTRKSFTANKAKTSNPNIFRARTAKISSPNISKTYNLLHNLLQPSATTLSMANVFEPRHGAPEEGFRCYDDFSKSQLSFVLPLRLELFLVLFLLPFAVTIFCYVNFIRHLVARPNIPLEKKQRAVGLAVATMVNFSICFAPYNLSHVVGFVEQQSPSWRHYTLVLTSLNAALDPLVFYFSSTAVQQAVAGLVAATRRKLVACCCHRPAATGDGSPA